MAQKLDDNELVGRVRRMRVWKRRDANAPHKPLLLLHALARLQRGESRLVRFADVEAPLRAMLETYSPSKGRQSPDFPFWHLQSDGLWEIPSGGAKPSGRNRPTLRSMRSLEGGFPQDVYEYLKAHHEAVSLLAGEILARHFPPSLHQDVLDEAGLAISPWTQETIPLPGETCTPARSQSIRTEEFRTEVLDAYEHRCAFCGYQCLLKGRSVLLEAAHVQWHAKGGPDEVQNGLALCSLHHKAFDLGVLSVTEKGTVLVSGKASGSGRFADLIVQLAGRSFNQPRLPGSKLRPRHVRWHAQNVFHGPAIAG